MKHFHQNKVIIYKKFELLDHKASLDAIRGRMPLAQKENAVVIFRLIIIELQHRQKTTGINPLHQLISVKLKH